MRWDFKCPTCGWTVERVYPSLAVAEKSVEVCPEHGIRLERQTPAPAFRVEGFNAANGYAGAQS